ncbi:unnamed protein product [Toxocara canis]|nr:unnamed protein product [Toxocara canis]
MALSKRPMTAVGFPHSLAINGGGAGHSTLNMNYTMGLLPNSSAVAQPSPVSPIMANAGSANGVISPTAVQSVNGLAGSPHGAANLNFSQSFQYQLAAMQAQVKAQQAQPNHAQLLKQMQAAHEHSLAQAQVRAQAEAQARAHAEAQARVQAHAQAQARAQAQAEAAQVNQAHAQAQALQQAQQAAALAQQRSLINSGVTTAHEYYYAHAQRAASLPDYLARLAAQQQHSQVPTASSSTTPGRMYPPSASEQFLLHQHHQQQQLLQQNNALRQQTQQQQLQLAAVAAAAAAATQQQQQQQSSPIAIPSVPRLPTMSAPVFTSHSGLHGPIVTPSTSTASGPTPIVRMRAPTVSAMGPHDDRRYHEFLAGVMQLERQIAENLMASTNSAEQAAATANTIQSLAVPNVQASGLLEKQAID